MKKGLVCGNNFALAEVMATYKDVFSFMPILFVYEGLNSEVVINSLTPNIDLNAVRNIDSEKLFQHIDVLATVGKLPISLRKFISWHQTLSPQTKPPIVKNKIDVNYISEELYATYHFVADVVRKVRAYGYRVAVSTEVAELDEMVGLMLQDKNPDVLINFCSARKSAYHLVTMEKLSDTGNAVSYDIAIYCKNCISKETWLKRDLILFGNSDFKNLHLYEVRGTKYLFKSCNRSMDAISNKLEEVAKAYFLKNVAILRNCDYQFIWQFSKIRYYERVKSDEFKTLFSFPYLKIENINDVILSYLGDRKCNLACEYCFSDHQKQEPAALSRSEVVKIADYVTKGNRDLNLHIDNYIGGEPCLEFEMVKQMYYTMFAYHKAYGYDTSFGFLTNGTKLTANQLEWLKKNVPYVGFSLDGDKKTNDAVRHDFAGCGSYAAVESAIRKMRAMEWPVEIGVSCVLTANNVNIKDLFIHFVDELGIKNVVIKPVRAPETSDIALTTKNIASLKKGYRDLFDFLFKKAKKGDISYLQTMLMPLDYAGRFFIRTFLEDRVVVKRCGSSEHIFSVGNDARIYACDSFNGTDVGFVADTRTGKINRTYRVPFVTQERFGCDSCWARYLCGGVCQYVQYVNNYEKNSVTSFECELAKFLIEEAICFWTKARKEFSSDTLNEIRLHIENIGFRHYKYRDSFYYAPC